MTATGQRRASTHALRVTEESAAFRALFGAVREEGERAGWLDFEAGKGASAGASAAPALDAATGGDAPERAMGDGAWKTVTVERQRTVAIKTRRGPPVLRDLLREHFQGCHVVLVRGPVALPALRTRGADWELVALDGAVRRLTTAELIRALRSPHLGV